MIRFRENNTKLVFKEIQLKDIPVLENLLIESFLSMSAIQ